MNLKRSTRAGLLVLSAVFSSSVLATNGIFLIGYGAKSRAMGGVGIGYTQDAIGNHMNPAGITTIGVNAMRIDADLMLFRPIRGATIPDNRPPPNAGDPVHYQSGANIYAIPAMGGVYKFNRKMYIGFSFVGAGGGGTRYTDLSSIGFNFLNPASRDDVSDTLSINYLQAQMSVGVAYKLSKAHSVAVNPVFGIQSFRASGLGVFKPFSNDPDNLTDRGNDFAYGVGVRLGYQGHLTDWLTVGATYSSRMYFTKFDKYRGLFAEQGGLDAPENFGLGFSLKPFKKLTLAFDWQRVLYSDVRAIGNPIENLNTTPGFLGNDAGAGFGWEDQDVFKVGLKYALTPRLDVALGYNYGESPIPNDQLLFSSLAPAVTEKHATLGATYRPSKTIEWSFAYVHAFKNTQKDVANSGGQFDVFFPNADLTGPGPVELDMYQDSIELSFSYKI